jgi:hypothetical protein
MVVTRALAPEGPLDIRGEWGAGEARSVTASYVLERGFRQREFAQIGERRVFEGYRVMVFYEGKLQDEAAMPRRILQLPPPTLPPGLSR